MYVSLNQSILVYTKTKCFFSHDVMMIWTEYIRCTNSPPDQ